MTLEELRAMVGVVEEGERTTDAHGSRAELCGERFNITIQRTGFAGDATAGNVADAILDLLTNTEVQA